MRVLVFFILALWGVSASAITLTHLYEANVPVSNLSSQSRAAALQIGFQQMLIRLSGNAAVMHNAAIKQADPSRYLEEYEDTSSDSGHTTLHFVFSESAVKTLLANAGQSIWGANRPAVLVWVVEKNAQQTKLIGADDDQAMMSALQKDAKMRGLPLLFPMLDISDMQAISAESLWQGDQQTLLTASSRYAPDAILLIRIDALDPSALSTTWQLWVQGSAENWQITGANSDSIVQQGVDDVSDYLAQQYAVSASGDNVAQTVSVVVDKIANAKAFAHLSRYLSKLSVVKSLALQSVSADHFTFVLNLNGSVQALVREIALSHILVPVTTSDQATGNSLAYQYEG